LTRFNILDIFRLSATPPSIIYPIPLFAFVVFSLSHPKLSYLIFGIVFTFTSQAGINLWNHVNDIEEDILAGKMNFLIQNPDIKNWVAILSFLLYLLSFILIFCFAIDRIVALISFSAVTLATWVYSDRMFYGKHLRRWKDYYITEVMTYLISIPSYTIAVWAFMARINVKTFALSILMTVFMLSGMVLKDLKDVSGDEKAGLKTLAVVLSPSVLLKTSVALSWCYFILIFIFSLFNLLTRQSVVAVLPALLFIKSTISLLKNNWVIDERVAVAIRQMILSEVVSLILLATVNLVFPA